MEDDMGIKSRILVAIAKTGFRQRFLVARMTRIDPIGRFVERLLFDEDEMIYLPRDGTVSGAAEKTVTVQMDKAFTHTNTVLPSQILDHFIRQSRHHFLMDFCICRDANDCRDYPKDYGCLFLGRGALRIDRKYGRLVTADEAVEHMRKCREAGLVHLIGRNKIDSVVFDTGAKEDLLSICSCCPCCCLWKMLPDLSADISSGVSRMPGVTVSFNDKCTGCGKCVEEKVCFVDALSMSDGKAHRDDARCRGCGRCAEFCPQKAVEIRIEDPGFFEKSVEKIEPLVDLKAE